MLVTDEGKKHLEEDSIIGLLGKWCMSNDAHMLCYPKHSDGRNVSADVKQSGLYRANRLVKFLDENGYTIIRKT